MSIRFTGFGLMVCLLDMDTGKLGKRLLKLPKNCFQNQKEAKPSPVNMWVIK